MKFKKILIIFLCVALLLAFSLSCFATSQESYGFYISPGDYVFDLDPFLGFSVNLFFRFDFTRLNSDIVFRGLYFYPNYSTIYYAITIPIASDSVRLAFSEGSWVDDDFRYITVLDGFYIYDVNSFQWWQSNVTRVSPGYNSSFFDNVLSIFTAIGQWISGAAANLTSMFFVDNSLTFVGTLSIAALAMAVLFLIIGLISRFLIFNG